MAESPSSALPGGVQWLPAIGGAHLLRAEVGRGEPPTLVLQSTHGGEHRLTAGPQTRFNRSADFLIPAGLRWAVAVLVWQDGTRAVLPDPPAGRAEVIDLASRRVPPAVPAEPAPDTPAPLPWTASPWEESAGGAASPSSAAAPSSTAAPSPAAPAPTAAAPASAAAPSSVTGAPSSAAAPSPDVSGSAGIETAIPASRAARAAESGTAVAAGGYQAARADLKADLSRAVEALSHAHETEQVADSAVEAILSGAQSDLQAERAARAADLSVLGAQSQLLALRAELERARTEITQLRTALESERLARVAAEAALGSPVPAGDLTELASQQTEVAASAPRRSPEEADRLVAALEAAANSLRATVPPPSADDAAGVRSERSAQRTFATAPLSPPDAIAPADVAPAEPVLDGLGAGARTVAPAEPVPDGLVTGANAATLDDPVRAALAAAGEAAAPDEPDPVGPAAGANAAALDDPVRAGLAAAGEAAAPDDPDPVGPAAGANAAALDDPVRAGLAAAGEAAAPDDPDPVGPAAGANAAAPDDPDPAGLAVGAGAAAPAEPDPEGLAAELTDVAPGGLAPLSTLPADVAPAGVVSSVVDHRPVIVATVAARAAAEAARQALAQVVAPAPGLRRALLTLAHEAPETAGALIAGLLPAQGAILDGPLSYDLTVRGYGTFAVTIGHGGTEVQRLTKRRPRKEAAFHIAGEPVVLAQLLAGERKRLGRFKPSARITGRRRRARAALGVIPASTISLAEAVKAGARLEPALVYSALPYAVSPEWTKGHVFTVAQEIRELGPRAWYVTARDGVRLSVVEHAAGAAADATVTMSRAAFDRLIKGEPPAHGDLPVIRGNRDAVAALKRWTDLARNEPRA